MIENNTFKKVETRGLATELLQQLYNFKKVETLTCHVDINNFSFYLSIYFPHLFFVHHFPMTSLVPSSIKHAFIPFIKPFIILM